MNTKGRLIIDGEKLDQEYKIEMEQGFNDEVLWKGEISCVTSSSPPPDVMKAVNSVDGNQIELELADGSIGYIKLYFRRRRVGNQLEFWSNFHAV